MKRRINGRAAARAVVVVLLPTLGSLCLAQDGIDLGVQRGPGTDEVTLQWTGGLSPWEIFSSADPAEIGDPASRVDESTASTWIDSPPFADVVFYRVTNCGIPPGPDPHGCVSCQCCDPWLVSWDPVPCTSHYVVRWRCSILPEQVWDVGDVTSVDLCLDVGMCSDNSCAFDVGYIRVEACNATGCSPPADVPAIELPLICGGGCCC